MNQTWNFFGQIYSKLMGIYFIIMIPNENLFLYRHALKASSKKCFYFITFYAKITNFISVACYSGIQHRVDEMKTQEVLVYVQWLASQYCFDKKGTQYLTAFTLILKQNIKKKKNHPFHAYLLSIDYTFIEPFIKFLIEACCSFSDGINLLQQAQMKALKSCFGKVS